jgi:peptidoglycan/xylan/chitin deacetylase (PgdA/CDA1 family)
MSLGWSATVWAVEIPVFTYHDIVEMKGADLYEITAKDFARQMQYLKDEDYTPVSLRQIDQSRAGKTSLPAKPVLLTFDDGLQSFTKFALPVLRQYGFPVVLSIVTAWVDGREVPPAYRGRLLSWEDLRALTDVPLVEIISHSDDLHHGVRSNPQGNEAPAGVTRIYDPQTGRYETENAFRIRIGADLARSRSRMVMMLGKTPIAVAWPYGAYDAVTVEEARRLGMVYHLTLDEDPTTSVTLPRINRSIFKRYRDLRQLDDALTFRKQRTEQLRFVEMTLDGFAGQDPAEQERALSALLSRLQLLQVNAVIVDPFARDRKAAFFPSAPMPMAVNVLNRVLHQIETRAEIEHIFLKVPLDLPSKDRLAVYRELARLHRFRGIILTGKTEETERAKIVEMLRYYHPALLVGFAAGSSAESIADFVYLSLDPATGPHAISQRVAEINASGKRALFVLDRPRAFDDDQLVSAMRAVRNAGAVHYGYANDEFQADRPALRRIVKDLAAHTVTEAKK